MQIIFTDKCKYNIIHAEGGIKLNLKGYAFYDGVLKDEDIPGLVLSDLEESKIVCKNTITDTYDLRENLFDFTYIPALDASIVAKNDNESSNIVAAKMGHYEIDINKGITEKTFSHILIIGEEFNETDKYTIDKRKTYLAAVITNVDAELETPKKIVFKVSLTDFKEDEIITNLRVIDTDFNEFTQNEFMKDFNTIQLPDNYTLTPDRKNKDYDAEINIIKFDSEEGNNNVKSHPTNLVLLDKSEKINNNWNKRARVTLGLDNFDKKCITPHLELSYGLKDSTDEFVLNSVDFQYDTNHFGINQCTGINKLQVDIFPEDIDVENKRCIKKRVKRSNLFDYSLVSANKAFFKYDSHNSKYTEGANYTFEFINKNNTLGTLQFPVKNVTLIRSSDNSLSGNNSNSLLLNSNGNKLGYSFTDSTLINSSGTEFTNEGVYYAQGSTTPEYRSRFTNNVLIGTEDVIASVVPSSVFTNNITFIGKNKLSTYAVATAENIALTDNFNTIPSIVSSTALTAFKNVDIGYEDDSYLNNLNVGNEALIGFNGLSVDRLPNNQLFYKSYEQIGYNKETKKAYYYYSNPVEQSDTTYAIKMGSYNSNYNPAALNAIVYDTMDEYMNDGNEYSDTFSSYYNPDNTFEVSAENVYKLYFKHSQDSLYTKNHSFSELSADEGDFSIEKLFAIGNGYDLLGKNVTGYSPAQMASNRYSAGGYCNKIDLFSVEKDSYQLVHDLDSPDYATVHHFPSMFAVRSTVPVARKTFHYRRGNVLSTETTYNKFNLQNAVYTPKGIYIPRKITSNDVYPLSFDTLNSFAENGGDTTTFPTFNFENITRLCSSIKSFVYECHGIEKNNKITYDVYIQDIINDLNTKYKKLGITIPYTKNRAGNSSQVYTFYLINTSIDTNLKFYGELRGTSTAPKTKALKTLKPGECVELLYCDCYYVNGNNIGGVLNLVYK